MVHRLLALFGAGTSPAEAWNTGASSGISNPEGDGSGENQEEPTGCCRYSSFLTGSAGRASKGREKRATPFPRQATLGAKKRKRTRKTHNVSTSRNLQGSWIPNQLQQQILLHYFTLLSFNWQKPAHNNIRKV